MSCEEELKKLNEMFENVDFWGFKKLYSKLEKNGCIEKMYVVYKIRTWVEEYYAGTYPEEDEWNIGHEISIYGLFNSREEAENFIKKYNLCRNDLHITRVIDKRHIAIWAMDRDGVKHVRQREEFSFDAEKELEYLRSLKKEIEDNPELFDEIGVTEHIDKLIKALEERDENGS